MVLTEILKSRIKTREKPKEREKLGSYFKRVGDTGRL